ncbi:hypothetical protein PF004_g26290 [Phytophthora fragariae]|uniref:Uncharacterized protein n=1 Tax=Phytophthora fragariae TaxID=53985 RepID=A0A6G0MPL4_9STRA|nr:hypothetical protein PF004_g26290 [Phytophthora fragariae]
MVPVRRLGWSVTRNDPARRRQEERPQLLHGDEVKAETSHPFGSGGKCTAGELPAEPLEAALEDEARADEEVDESSPLESPELPGPGPDPPRVAVWPLGEERAGCAGDEQRKAADPAEYAGPAECAERVDATEAERERERELDRGCGGGGNATANEAADEPETANETQGHATEDAWTVLAAPDRRCPKTRSRRAPRPLGRAPQLQRPRRA